MCSVFLKCYKTDGPDQECRHVYTLRVSHACFLLVAYVHLYKLVYRFISMECKAPSRVHLELVLFWSILYMLIGANLLMYLRNSSNRFHSVIPHLQPEIFPNSNRKEALSLFEFFGSFLPISCINLLRVYISLTVMQW